MGLSIYLKVNMCSHCGRADEVFSQSITHNLTEMATEAGIYKILWYSEENEINEAKQLIAPLHKAIMEMKADPERFKKFNSSNNYGLYKQFVPWLERLLAACKETPDAKVISWG